MSVLPKATLGYVTTTWPDGVVKRVNWDCMCDQLRACEQRVLNATQEAIRNREDGEYFPWVQVEIALAAIDALREV